MTTPERSVEEKWQTTFLNAGTEKGLGDLSMMIGVVSEILQAERQKREEVVEAERERILKEYRLCVGLEEVAKHSFLKSLKKIDE